MYHSGITRRIDDLGRICLPRGLREELNLKDGDPLEICHENGNVILVPYSPVPEHERAIECLETYLGDLKARGVDITDLREATNLLRTQLID